MAKVSLATKGDSEIVGEGGKRSAREKSFSTNVIPRRFLYSLRKKKIEAITHSKDQSGYNPRKALHLGNFIKGEVPTLSLKKWGGA